MTNPALVDAPKFSWIYRLVIAIISIQFILNFAGSHLVKEVYLLSLVLVILGVWLLPQEEGLHLIIYFSLIEGQGRILWGYASFARLSMDFLMVLTILKSTLINSSVFNFKRIPTFFSLCIVLHFIWFVIQLFNPNGAGFFPSFVTAKYYILPILFFLSIRNVPILSDNKKTNRFLNYVMLFLVAEISLALFQKFMGSDFMDQLSPYYLNLFPHFKIFTGFNFRPWGTSHQPGGIAPYLALTVGFAFYAFRHKKGSKFLWPCALFIISSWVVLFLLQVRAAWIRHIFVVFTCIWLGFFSPGKKRLEKIFRPALVLIVLSFLSLSYFSKEFKNLNEVLDLDVSLSRILALKEEGILSQRAGIDNLEEVITKRTPFPMGFGLGMTTKYMPQFEVRRRQYLSTPRWYFWNLDNLFAFLYLELGIGAIFYILIGLIPLFMFIPLLMKMRRLGHEKEFHILSICVASIAAIIAGNWGAVGLPFNPESFYYWIWVAIGYQLYYQVKAKDGKTNS